MKLRITHLKAPWPEGAKVGDVVDLPGVPAWALGKCELVNDDAAATAEPVNQAEPVAAPVKGKGKG